MTSRPPVVDELRDRTRRLEAERLRPQHPLPPRRVATDLHLLIGILARLLTNPGPPDPAPTSPKATR